MSSFYVRYLVPALVLAASAILMTLGHRRRTRRTAVWEHSTRIVEGAAVVAPPDPAAEQAWRRLHSLDVEAWLATHEALLDRASANGFADAPAELQAAGDEGAEWLDAAVAAHPDPARRAELSVLLGAARSTLAALVQGDYTRARRHHLVYRDYRDRWRERPAAGGGE